MSPLEIITIIASVLIVGGVIIKSIINKKQGKTSCCGDCSCCQGCSNQKNKTK